MGYPPYPTRPWLFDPYSPDGSRPVVVEMGELVGDPLDVVRLETGVVPYHVEGGRRHRALPHRLRDQKEVVPAGEKS